MLAGSALALATERVTAPVEGIHLAISRRWFGAIGSPARPVQRVHDAVTSTTYALVRLGGAAIGLAVDTRVDDRSPAASSAQSIVNGFWGDALDASDDRLGLTMGMRDRDGQAVPSDADLGRAFPDATGSLIVLVHGLMETDRCWSSADAEPGLFRGLAEHPDLTPVTVRYNTGRRISDNGALLADILESVLARWPVPVERLALVGHSMGGLVIRSACLSAAARGHQWIGFVNDVVTLGAPHRGAPLEKFVNAASWALGATSETRPLADFLNARSGGIKDLRFGAVAEGDWRGVDPDALLRNTVGDHTLPAGIRHHFVSGTITADPKHPVGAIVGDLVVRPSSSSGRRLEPTTVTVVGGARHPDLPRDAAVIDHVMGWLTER